MREGEVPGLLMILGVRCHGSVRLPGKGAKERVLGKGAEEGLLR